MDNKLLQNSTKHIVRRIGVPFLGVILFLLGFFAGNNIQFNSLNHLVQSGREDGGVEQSYTSYPQTTQAPALEIETYIASELYESGTSCNGNECLFNTIDEGYVEGYAVLEGYYSQDEKEAWGVKGLCDVLVVTGGSKRLIESLRGIAENGNSINRVDKNGNLLVTINSNEIDQNSKEILLSSSVFNPVALGAIKVTPVGRGASVCSSNLDVLYIR